MGPLKFHHPYRHSWSVVYPGRWAVAIGIDTDLTCPRIHKETIRWIDKHNIHQSLTTIRVLRRYAITVTRSLHARATVDQVSRWSQARKVMAKARKRFQPSSR